MSTTKKPQPHEHTVPTRSAQARQKPVAPPVYRPQPTPRVLQRKTHVAVGTAPPRQQSPASAARQQPHKPAPAAAAAIQPKKPPTAPPVYRPQPTPKVLQTKSALPAQAPRASGPGCRHPSPGRPAARPGAPAVQPAAVRAGMFGRPPARGIVQCVLPKTGVVDGLPGGKEEDPSNQGSDKKRSIERQNEAARILAAAGYKVVNTPQVVDSDNLLKNDPDYRIEGIIFDGYPPVDTQPSNPLTAKYEALNKGQGSPQLTRAEELYAMARMEQLDNGEFDEYDDSVSGTFYGAQYQSLQTDLKLTGIRNHISGKVSTGQARNIVLNLSDTSLTASQVESFLRSHPVASLENVLIIKPKSGGGGFDITEINF